MPPLDTIVGTAAAFCTAISNLPQLRKALSTGETGDLSLRMLFLLAVGLSLWTLYGFMRGDVVIIAANSISLAMVLAIGAIKLRNRDR